MAVALVPGSFDPPTNGHIDVIERAARHFEKVIVSVVVNPSKDPLFDAEERIGLLKDALAHLTNIEVLAHEGLTVVLAAERHADVIVRGLRAVSDLEYELQMAQMNASLQSEVDTLFIPPDPRWSFISSSLVKEVARFGRDVSELVPKGVAEALSRRFG
ncbi:MAG TPA: pantetheine-phosphate adenylyltransferase [Actinomycetota bacterium]|nr:pantetheine-phosphate adenylyltransferase [Actinomycetota bacterium]